MPDSLTAIKFLSKLNKKVDFEIASQQYTLKTFYDSFDWRLYNADIIFELNQSKSASHISLLDRNTGECLALEEEQQHVPQFTEQFREGRLKTKISPVLEMRALFPLSQLPHHVYRLNILNKDKKNDLTH